VYQHQFPENASEWPKVSKTITIMAKWPEPDFSITSENLRANVEHPNHLLNP
jgi:hypothetical protein